MGVFTEEDFDDLENEEPEGKPPVVEDEDVDVGEDSDDEQDESEDDEDESEDESDESDDYRYGDDAPEELRGLTPKQALEVYGTLRRTAQGLATRLQQPQQQAQPQPQPQPQDFSITEEELLGGDSAKVNAKLQQLLDAKTRPFVEDYYQNQAQLVYMQARNNPALKYFQKYEQEILGLAQQASTAQMANPSSWKWLHDQVVANHLDEIVQEEAKVKKNRPKPPSQERGKGNSRKARPVKLTKVQRSVARGLGMSEQEYAAMIPLIEQDT